MCEREGKGQLWRFGVFLSKLKKQKLHDKKLSWNEYATVSVHHRGSWAPRVTTSSRLSSSGLQWGDIWCTEGCYGMGHPDSSPGSGGEWTLVDTVSSPDCPFPCLATTSSFFHTSGACNLQSVFSSIVPVHIYYMVSQVLSSSSPRQSQFPPPGSSTDFSNIWSPGLSRPPSLSTFGSSSNLSSQLGWLSHSHLWSYSCLFAQTSFFCIKYVPSLTIFHAPVFFHCEGVSTLLETSNLPKLLYTDSVPTVIISAALSSGHYFLLMLPTQIGKTWEPRTVWLEKWRGLLGNWIWSASAGKH